jgi:hypothetical protein
MRDDSYYFREVPVTSHEGVKNSSYDKKTLLFSDNWYCEIGYNNLGELLIKALVSFMPNPYDYFKGEDQYVYMLYKVTKEKLQSFIDLKITYRELLESAIENEYHTYERYMVDGDEKNPLSWSLEELVLVHSEWVPSKDEVTLESDIMLNKQCPIPQSFI